MVISWCFRSIQRLPGGAFERRMQAQVVLDQPTRECFGGFSNWRREIVELVFILISRLHCGHSYTSAYSYSWGSFDRMASNITVLERTRNRVVHTNGPPCVIDHERQDSISRSSTLPRIRRKTWRAVLA